MSKLFMFVDDDEAFLRLTARVSTKMLGLPRPLQAMDGEEAAGVLLRLVRANEALPDLLFLDINMPRMNGFEFLTELGALREKHPRLREIRVAMLTSSDQRSDKDRARALGADEYLVKPVGLSQIRATLEPFVG